METSQAIGDELREQSLAMTFVRLECTACAKWAWTGNPHEIAELVEHCVFDHVSRAGIIGVSNTELVDAYTLAERRGAAVQTDWEQKWREARERERLSSATA